MSQEGTSHCSPCHGRRKRTRLSHLCTKSSTSSRHPHPSQGAHGTPQSQCSLSERTGEISKGKSAGSVFPKDNRSRGDGISPGITCTSRCSVQNWPRQDRATQNPTPSQGMGKGNGEGDNHELSQTPEHRQGHHSHTPAPAGPSLGCSGQPWLPPAAPSKHLKCSQRSMEILSDCKSRLDIPRFPGNPQAPLSTDLP